MKFLAGLLAFFLFAGTAYAEGPYRISTVQSVTVASSSTPADSVFGNYTRIIRLISTVSAHVAIGVSSQTATTSNTYIAAGREEYFVVRPGEHIAVIRSGSDGTLYVTEMTK